MPSVEDLEFLILSNVLLGVLDRWSEKNNIMWTDLQDVFSSDDGVKASRDAEWWSEIAV